MKHLLQNRWVKAFRLRTLPLAFSGILLGTCLAIYAGYFSWLVFLLATTTALSLQILSNLANDYGDSMKGTDNENRIGPARAMQTGIIDQSEMLDGIVAFATISFISGILLVFLASGLSVYVKLVFLVLGIGAIVAAIKYTVGSSAYGYIGLGDVFVFLFFGLICVLGSTFLFQHTLELSQLLPAASFGLFSAGVLNVNNMRDTINDYESGKITLAVRLGTKKARYYHATIIVIGVALMFVYSWLNFEQWLQLIYLPATVLYAYHLFKIFSAKYYHEFDPLLKQLALTTCLNILLFSLGLVLAYFT